MKKAIISVASMLFVFASMFICSEAAEIEILAPSDNEVQIAPTRDFYVVGTIKRSRGENEPLNVVVELSDEEGNVVRSLESNVSSDGATPNYCIFTDYEGGYSENSQKGVNLYSFAPPDLIYDGFGYESVLKASSKVVVKDGYFAAAIYCGATKDYDLQYVSKYDQPIGDIEEGVYTLTVTAVNSDGEEVCSAAKEINIGSDVTRIIYNSDAADSVDVKEFAEESGASIVSSVVGYWHPSDFISAPKDYTYTINTRYMYNLKAEYEAAEKIKLLLYGVDTDLKKINIALGSTENDSDIEYFYYDIGEPSVKFDFVGGALERKGNLIEAAENTFVNVQRAATNYDGSVFVDFEPENGVVLTSNCETVFSGVYSPIGISAERTNDGYSVSDSVATVRAVITDGENNVIYETECKPFIYREYGDESRFVSSYEFEFSVVPEDSLASDDLSLTVMLCDDVRKVLCSESIPCAIKEQGDFITGYGDSYWGKIYCDEINLFGTAPTKESIEADDKILRGDFAAMINRLFGFAESGGEVFSDIDEENPYYYEVMTAQAAGYMSGDENLCINAESPITREEAIIILSRICGAEKGDLEPEFKDYDEISFWAEDAVEIMCSTGIITGFEGYLHPKDSITSAEAAALICKTVAWMYGGAAAEPAAEKPSHAIEFDSAELSDVEIDDLTVVEEVDRSELERFITNNLAVLDSLKNYIVSSCQDGAYVRKAGAGLEIRDYRRGSYINMPDDAIRLMTELANKYNSFTLRYNPLNEDAIYFGFAKDDNDKEFGIAFSVSGESSSRELESIFGNWYYYTQK